MGDKHTQRSWLGWILTGTGFGLVVMAMLFSGRTVPGAGSRGNQ